MKEIWKQHPNGEFFVSNFGRVLSHKNKILKPNYVNGYAYVNVKENNVLTHKLVHRLVLETFDPKINSTNLDVNHKNYNSTDNRLENLEWTTHKDNCLHRSKNPNNKYAGITQKRIKIGFYKDDLEKLEQYKQLNGVSYSEIIREAVHQYLTK